MPLLAGDRLGRYEILAPLGAGGMGEVYRARDTELERDVAIKVLPEAVAQNADRLERFKREAKAVAKLAHPNILEIWDYGTEGDTTYSVTELLEGETLRERLEGGSLGWRKATEIGAAIADGLAAAHDKGVVHRDLKPENIFVTEDGRVKILDFGLARLHGPITSEGETETPTPADTARGVVLGTVGYMSPEQVKGETVDGRSDIFSLGCIIYEMVSGHRAFLRDTAVETMSAILKDEPEDILDLGEALSPELAETVRRCLEKQPQSRFQSGADLAFALRSLSGDDDEMPSGRVQPTLTSHLRRMWALVAVATLVGVAAFALYAAGLWDWLTGGTSASPITSVAVLPLGNLSGDPEQGYFADGMTEALIAELSKIGALRVISRQSVMQFKGSTTTLTEISRALDVEAVVEGSVLRSGEKVRITTQLVQADPERHLWAESYERNLRDVLSLQREVARQIAREIEATLTPDEESRFASVPAVDPQAHEAYLKARHSMRLGGAGHSKAIEYFEEALIRDPNFALAYAGLADFYIQAAHGLLPPWEAFPQAKAAARKALALDESLVEAHTSLADASYHYDYDWAGAEASFQRVFQLDPGNARAHVWYSGLLAAQGRFDEVFEEVGVAKRLDPLSRTTRHNSARWLFYARRYDEVMREIEQIAELYPEYQSELYALVLSQKGMHGQAIDMLERIVAEYETNSHAISALAQAYAAADRLGDAQTVTEHLEVLSQETYVPPHLIALAHTALGQLDGALAWLDQAYEVRDAALIWVNVDPRFDSLRSDPRFQDLLRRMNLPAD